MGCKVTCRVTDRMPNTKDRLLQSAKIFRFDRHCTKILLDTQSFAEVQPYLPYTVAAESVTRSCCSQVRRIMEKFHADFSNGWKVHYTDCTGYSVKQRGRKARGGGEDIMNWSKLRRGNRNTARRHSVVVSCEDLHQLSSSNFTFDIFQHLFLYN